MNNVANPTDTPQLVRKRSTRVPAIDLVLVLAFLGIVMVHVNANGLFGQESAIGYLLSELGRFAIPLFFMASGYFAPKYSREDGLAITLKRLCKRMLLPYTLWFFVYNIMGLSDLIMNPTSHGFLELIVQYFVTGGADGRMSAMHLWFLPALVFGTMFCAVLHHLFRRQQDAKVGIVILLYLLGYMGYSKIMGLAHFTLPIGVLRNGLFFAPLFIMFGMLIKQYDKLFQLERGTSVVFAVLGITVHLVEAMFQFKGFISAHDYSLGIPLLVYGIFCLSIETKIKRSRFVVRSAEAIFAACCIHMAFVVSAHKLLPVYNSLTGLMVVALVFAASLASALALRKVEILWPRVA